VLASARHLLIVVRLGVRKGSQGLANWSRTVAVSDLVQETPRGSRQPPQFGERGGLGLQNVADRARGRASRRADEPADRSHARIMPARGGDETPGHALGADEAGAAWRAVSTVSALNMLPRGR